MPNSSRTTNNSAGNRGGGNNTNNNNVAPNAANPPNNANNATGATVDLAALTQAILNAGVANPPAASYSTVTDAYDHTNWSRLGDPRVADAYLRASEPAPDFERIDIGVPTAHRLMEFLKDKERTFGWGSLTNVPLDGTGEIAAAPKRLPGGGVTHDVGFGTTGNLFTNYTVVSELKCNNYVG